MTSLLKGNEDIASSKPDTKQGLAKTTSLKENNSQNITKRKRLEKLMAKKADPKRIPEIEKLNDSINNTKSPETNKNFFTKGIEIVFNTLDKRLIKPLIKLAQQITGFKSSKEGTSSENAEDPEQAKLIQEIANKELDLSKVKDHKKRKRIEVLQKRLGDEGLKLNAEAKVALAGIIRGAETKGEFNQAALPDCCRVVVNDSADTKASIEKTTLRFLDRVGRNDSSESLRGGESSQVDIRITPSEAPAASTIQKPKVLESLLNTVQEDVKARVAAGSLTSAQGELFYNLMADPKIQENINGYYDRSGPEKVANFFGTLIDRELPYYEGGGGSGTDYPQYVEWINQVTNQGIEVTTVSSLSMNSDPLVSIELENGPEARKTAEKQIKIADQLNKELDTEIEEKADEIYMHLRTESTKFKEAVTAGKRIDLYGEIIEAIQGGKTNELIEKYSPESNTVNDTPNIQTPNTLQIHKNETKNAEIATPQECLEAKIEVTTTVIQTPSNNILTEQEKGPEIIVSAQEISPEINHQEDKLSAALSELHR